MPTTPLLQRSAFAVAKQMLPGIGHFLHMEEPSVVQIYREFLTRPE